MKRKIFSLLIPIFFCWVLAMTVAWSGVLPRCGNGWVEEAEECDDGNRTNGDRCSCACAWEPLPPDHCGNHICEANEGYEGPANCQYDCCTEFAFVIKCQPNLPRHRVRCGDCVLEGSEQCDDGNSQNSDGCSSGCLRETAVCGNGILERWGNEECEDGNRANNDGCSSTCRRERSTCGNGILESWAEECDDGNRILTDGCNSNCRIERGRPSGGEPPEDGSGDGSGGGCSGYFGGLCCGIEPDCPEGALERGYLGFPLCSQCQEDGSVRYFTRFTGRCGPLTANQAPTFGVNDCPSGRCDNGACTGTVPPSLSCADSDGGINAAVAGTISGVGLEGSYTMSDSCENDTVVLEHSCRDRAPVERGIPCRAGEHCNDGFCLSGSTATPSCTDSDRFNSPTLLGTVSGVGTDGTVYSLSDTCNGNGGVTEYFCDSSSGEQGSREIPCGENERCQDGACILPCPCQRLPGLLTSYVIGVDCQVQHDICVEGNRIQFSCDSNGMPIPSSTTSCPNGCNNGRCL